MTQYLAAATCTNQKFLHTCITARPSRLQCNIQHLLRFGLMHHAGNTSDAKYATLLASFMTMSDRP